MDVDCKFTEDAEKVIAELCALSPNKAVRDVVRSYSPEKTTKQLTMCFNQYNQPLLTETLDYLNMPNRTEYKKSANVEALIFRIQNLLPEVCGICKNTYTTKNSDINLLSCSLCGQEAHQSCLLKLLKTEDDKLTQISKTDVQRIINPCNIPGFHYFCHTCSAQALGNEDDGLKKSVKKKGTNKVPEVPTQVTLPVEGGEHSPSSEMLNNDGDGDHALDGDNENSQRVNENDVPVKKTTICKFYAKGCSCKHGMSGKRGGECSFLHPKVCSRMLFKGKCFSKDCKKYHPKMCYNALNTGQCLRKNCGYWHLKKTVRDYPAPYFNRDDECYKNDDGRWCQHEEESPPRNHGSNANQEQESKLNANNRKDFLDAIQTIKDEMEVWQQNILLHISNTMNSVPNNVYHHQPQIMNQGMHSSQSQWIPQMHATHLPNPQGGMA